MMFKWIVFIGIVLDGLFGIVQASEECENAKLRDRVVQGCAVSNPLDQAQQDQLERVIQFLVPTGMRDEDRWAVHDGFPSTYSACIQTFIDPRFLSILERVIHSKQNGVSRRNVVHGIHRVTIDKWDEFEQAALQFLPRNKIINPEDSELISYLTVVPIAVLSNPKFLIIFNTLFPKDEMGEYKYVDDRHQVISQLGLMTPDKLIDPNFLPVLQGVTVVTNGWPSHSGMRSTAMHYLNILDKEHWNAFLITVQLFSTQYASANDRLWLFSYLRNCRPNGWGAYILENLEISAA